ncbi:Peroxidase-like protein [Leptotrombidium deliense]|uniref:Peroxidase-like protein n=1 Tax=Leptotrombidium deliense TaxID=299467 RepID=A0A443SSS1_9ACAR|nr:Peroxidase-like protein [Leptotrombidium deliense]
MLNFNKLCWVDHNETETTKDVNNRIELHLINKDDLISKVIHNGQCNEQIKCYHNKYRTADGSCNNLINSRWGKSFECVNRLQRPVYADGKGSPKVAKSGKRLPSARLISNVQHSSNYSASKFTHMLMQWGQFLDHDITSTAMSTLKHVFDCCFQSSHECYPIEIPKDDQFFSQFKSRCMSFIRSAPCSTCNKHREQINALTAFIDASNVYGSTDNETRTMRINDETGMLCSQRNGLLLPPPPNENDNDCSTRNHRIRFFAAGDVRVNVLPSLSALHTLFMRHHNSLCFHLKQINPHWDEETLFQEARRIVGAQLQLITFKEFLPLVLGNEYMDKFSLKLLQSGRTTYNNSLNPTLISEFSTAAFRFGHTLINGEFHRIKSNGESQRYLLRDNFFNPNPLHFGDIDNIIRGMIGTPSQRFNPSVAEDVRNYLFKRRHEKFGLDLIAVNIQRGRDHGIPGYTVFVNLCFGINITSFDDLETLMTRNSAKKYSSIYESVDDIDLYSGILSEQSLPDAILR